MYLLSMTRTITTRPIGATGMAGRTCVKAVGTIAILSKANGSVCLFVCLMSVCCMCVLGMFVCMSYVCMIVYHVCMYVCMYVCM